MYMCMSILWQREAMADYIKLQILHYNEVYLKITYAIILVI